MSTSLRIVQAFDTITNSLIEQENFTNATVVREDVAFTGQKVCEHNVKPLAFVDVM